MSNGHSSTDRPMMILPRGARPLYPAYFLALLDGAIRQKDGRAYTDGQIMRLAMTGAQPGAPSAYFADMLDGKIRHMGADGAENGGRPYTAAEVAGRFFSEMSRNGLGDMLSELRTAEGPEAEALDPAARASAADVSEAAQGAAVLERIRAMVSGELRDAEDQPYTLRAALHVFFAAMPEDLTIAIDEAPAEPPAGGGAEGRADQLPVSSLRARLFVLLHPEVRSVIGGEGGPVERLEIPDTIDDDRIVELVAYRLADLEEAARVALEGKKHMEQEANRLRECLAEEEAEAGRLRKAIEAGRRASAELDRQRAAAAALQEGKDRPLPASSGRPAAAPATGSELPIDDGSGPVVVPGAGARGGGVDGPWFDKDKGDKGGGTPGAAS